MKPKFRIEVGGRDFTDRFKGLTDITVTDNRAFIADTVALAVADPEGALDLPEKRAVIRLQIGYEGQPLEDKGAFTVDGLGISGPPDTLHIYARSANLKESMNVPKSRSFKETTLGAILEKVAKGQELKAVISPELGNLVITHLDQTNESDGHFISRLGRTYGAVATIKDDHLVFSPLSRGTTPAGTPVAAVTIERSDCESFTYDNRERSSEFTCVRARYHDLAAAKTKSIIIKVDGEDGKTKTLLETFPDEGQATAAAEAELRRLSDIGTTMTLELHEGWPRLIPETPVKLSGFRPSLDAMAWVVDQVTHKIGRGGFSSSIKLVPMTTK